jgi:hypothetical protein
MKKLLYIISLLFFLIPKGIGQTTPSFSLRSNGNFTPIDPRLSVPWNLYIPKGCDTINALHGGLDTLGALYYDVCHSKMYIRDTMPGGHYWRQVGMESLQQTTSYGTSTTDTVSLGGMRTQYILPDTSSQSDRL